MNPEFESAAAPRNATTRELSWARAGALAVGTIYLPLLGMCLYTTAFVSCSHCKQGVWIVAPFAPGGFVWEWTRHFLHLPRAAGVLTATVSGGLSLLIALALAVGLRHTRPGRGRFALLGTAGAAATCLAYAVFALMRA